MKTGLAIPFAIALGGIIVALAVYFTMAKKEPSTGSGTGNPALVRPVGPTDHILGNPAAPVKIVEYADFDCAYCKTFDSTLHQIIANEGASGKVAWVYREFPLEQIHPTALEDAEAAECVAQTAGNAAFWQFADALFANQPVNPTRFGALASQAGVTGPAFADCMANASTTVSARVSADAQNALDIGALGTPYSLILANGQAPVVMDGAYSYSAVKQLVDKALAAAGQ